MDTENSIALAAALIGALTLIVTVVSVIWSKRSAAAADRQAKAAERSNKLSEGQLGEAKKATKLAEQAAQNELDSKLLTLDVRLGFVKEQDNFWIEAIVENNSDMNANIQAVSLVFRDGQRYGKGSANGQIELTANGENKSLPGILKPGQRCTFRFCEYKRVNLLAPYRLTPPNYEEAHWNTPFEAEIEANNKAHKQLDVDPNFAKAFADRKPSVGFS